MRIWTEATLNAIRRHVARTGSPEFTRQELIRAERAAIEAETQTRGLTPTQTLGRELQQLRDAGLLDFVERGTYRWLGDMPAEEPATPSKGVFVIDPRATQDPPELHCCFPPAWSAILRRTVGQWVLYQDVRQAGGSYRAAVLVERIEHDPGGANLLRAAIRQGTYLEFGRIVPFERDGAIIERGLLDAHGRLLAARADQPVRAISDADFDRIVELGLVTDDELLPREDADEEPAAASQLADDRSVWEGPIDRTIMLVNRKVRDRQFRKRVLDVYGGRCALTGMKLINGGGRVETEAAHIRPVGAGGPDAIDNGIALSGTMHWMFDRGLVSLSDGGDILLSRAINDRDSVERLIHADRKARFPQVAAHRPHPRYLQWHRNECFHH